MFKILEIQLKYVLHVLKTTQSDTSLLGMCVQTIGYTHTQSGRQFKLKQEISASDLSAPSSASKSRVLHHLNH